MTSRRKKGGEVPRTLSDVIAENVRVLRAKKGWSQEALGKRAKLSGRHISIIERGGDNNLRLHTLESLSAAFGVTVFDLLTDEQTMGAVKGKQALRAAIMFLTDLERKV